MSTYSLAPGEENLATESFSPNIVLFWLKFDVTVTSRRIIARQPNTLLGIIPVGYDDLAIPLKSVAGLGVSVKFSLIRLILGLLALGFGLSSFDNSVGLALILTFLGIVFLVACLRAKLIIENSAGSAKNVIVSITEKAKLEQFRAQIDQRLHAVD